MASGTRARVLVLEDEWLIAEQIGGALAQAGYEIVGPVGRVRQAMDLLEREAVDLAVLDINVHEDRSFQVADRLAETATPFVFVSGYSDLEMPHSFSDRPLLQKPVDPDNLCRLMNHLLGR